MTCGYKGRFAGPKRCGRSRRSWSLPRAESRAWLSSSELDPLRDEAIDYAMRLLQAGVATELHVYPGAPHGFQLFGDSRLARQWQRDVDEWLGCQLASL